MANSQTWARTPKVDLADRLLAVLLFAVLVALMAAAALAGAGRVQAHLDTECAAGNPSACALDGRP